MLGFNPPAYGQPVLKKFGVDEDNLAGCGKSCRVYHLDAINVVRIYRPGTTEADVYRVKKLLDSLDASAVDFKIPNCLNIGSEEDFVFSIESRFGPSFEQASLYFPKDLLWQGYEQYAASAGDFNKIVLDHNKFGISKQCYGEISGVDLIRCGSWAEYLHARSEQCLKLGEADVLVEMPDFSLLLDAWHRSISNLAEPPKDLVHADFSLANATIAEDGSLEALIDLHDEVLIGDWRVSVVFGQVQAGLTGLSDENLKFVQSQFAKHKIDDEIFWTYAVFWALHYCYCKKENPTLFKYLIEVLRSASHYYR